MVNECEQGLLRGSIKECSNKGVGQRGKDNPTAALTETEWKKTVGRGAGLFWEGVKRGE